ncbi:MAG: ATP-binding protein [Verrucomicrobiota bacterium]|nr:ATP-binding protein [Verrucomicrobiota bacterium]
MTESKSFANPYRPGAGHMPPFLAGRTHETEEFRKLLEQSLILENMVLTGLRGVGKTVLLETFKPIALSEQWRWIGTDLSEAASLTEANVATRILTDLSVVTSSLTIGKQKAAPLGFSPNPSTDQEIKLGYESLIHLYNQTPGLVSDKLKAVLEFVAQALSNEPTRGLIFAYDEAQNLSDHAGKGEYPLSLILDVFQSIQKKGIPFMLVLTGLPTLFPKLVESRTYAERMFRVLFLDKLDETESKAAVLNPIKEQNCPVFFTPESVDKIVDISGGYPYFIQFIGREVYDVFIQQFSDGATPSVPVDSIYAKLDSDFFAGRWARATDRQRELMQVIASLDNCDSEFTVQEIADQSKKKLEKPFSNSHVNQMLSSLGNAGLVFKNRHGKYAFAVPLLGQFIHRQTVQQSVA